MPSHCGKSSLAVTLLRQHHFSLLDNTIQSSAPPLTYIHISFKHIWLLLGQCQRFLPLSNSLLEWNLNCQNSKPRQWKASCSPPPPAQAVRWPPLTHTSCKQTHTDRPGSCEGMYCHCQQASGYPGTAPSYVPTANEGCGEKRLCYSTVQKFGVTPHFFTFCFQEARLSCNFLTRSRLIVLYYFWSSFQGFLWTLASFSLIFSQVLIPDEEELFSLSLTFWIIPT